MALVINDVVKMEWNKDLWLQTSSRGGSPSIFIMAAHKYVNKDGKTISVIFVPDTAFLFVDDAGTENEDIWTAEDLRATLKSDFGGGYPYSYDQYTPIIGADADTDAVLEKYGLSEYKEDIEKRLDDISPYGEEKEYGM